MSMHVARQIFPITERMTRVVEVLVRSRAIELVRKHQNGEELVQLWELRGLLSHENWWSTQTNAAPEYCLRLTRAGYERFATDGQGFFDRLFQQ